MIISFAIIIAAYLWFKTDKQMNDENVVGGQVNGMFYIPQIFLIFVIVSGLLIYSGDVIDEQMKDSPTYNLIKVAFFGLFIVYGLYAIYIKDKK